MNENKGILIQDKGETFRKGGELYDADYLPVKDGGKHIPPNFNIGRDLELESPRMERYIFTSLEESQEEDAAFLEGLGNGISELTMAQITFAIGKILYNTSYLQGNLESNTGLSRNGILSEDDNGRTLRSEAKYTIQGEDYFVGEITVKLSELAAEAFGVQKANATQRKEVLNTIRKMQTIFIKDKYSSIAMPLVSIRYTYDDPKTKALVLNLVLHPIFAKRTATNYGTHPQNILTTLGASVKRRTYAQLALLRLLGIQRKDEPCRIYISKLLKVLHLEDIYKEHKSRAERQLQTAIDAMIACKIITKQPSVTKGATGEVMYCFSLNPSYSKTPEENDGKTQDGSL